MRVLLLVLAVAFCLAPRAQSDGTELAEAVVMMFSANADGAADIEVLADRLPDGFEARYLPAAATVLGGIIAQEDSGKDILVGIARLDGVPADLAQAFAETLRLDSTIQRAVFDPAAGGAPMVESCTVSGVELVTAFVRRRAGGAFATSLMEINGCQPSEPFTVLQDRALVDDMEDVIGDGEIIDEPYDHMDVIGDGEIIDCDTNECEDMVEAAAPPASVRPLFDTRGALDVSSASGQGWAHGRARFPVRDLDLIVSTVHRTYSAAGWRLMSQSASNHGRTLVWTRLDSASPEVVVVLVREMPGGMVEALVTVSG